MRKEIFFAIIAGGGLGLLIAFGIWRANVMLKPKDNGSTATSTKMPSATSFESGDLKIVIASPFNMAVLTQTEAVISGITKPKAYVVASGENSDNITNASDSGAFSSNVELTGGANQIQLDAYDANGNQAHTNLTLVYSGQFVSPSATAAASARAYIGTVTDISNGVIQIKTDKGDIQQISGTADASYVDTRNDTTKTIKSTDVAIGDYLVAMGIKDGNNILTSSRILVTDALKPPTRTSFIGVVTDDKGINKFVAKNIKTNESITVTPATGIVVNGETSFGKISNDEKFIAVGELKDGTFAARTILVLK